MDWNQIGTTRVKAVTSFKWNSSITTKSFKPDFTYYLTPNNTITFGGQYLHYESKPGTALAISSGEERNISIEPRYADESALYIGNDQKINKWLSLQYGIRYSYFRNLGPGEVFEFQEILVGERKYPISEKRYERKRGN